MLGLPTGRTPLELYRALVSAHQQGRASFARAHAFALDEYVGLEPQDPGSFASYLDRHLFSSVDFHPDRRHVFEGGAPDPTEACAVHQSALEALGGFHVLILGLGENGHVAFNEPAQTLRVHTHVAKLSRTTREANAGAFGGDPFRVPLEAMTIGMGAILRAREILVLATGERKRGALEAMSAGEVTTSCPASLLQLHAHVTVLTDLR